MADRLRVLIEEWLPVTELGIESRRESAPIPGQFPKLKTLHVWWARRPLAATAGAVLASVMPAWSQELADAFPEAMELRSERDYQKWFLRLCGILGDPVAAKRRAVANKAAGLRTTANPYSYKPAFKNSPSIADLVLLHRLLEHTWGRLPVVLDPTAGGGSIPFEAARYGLPVTANDLNPVAAAILKAGIEIPAALGLDLVADLKRWGGVLVGRVQARLVPFFPALPGEEVANYLFARTIVCPRTGKLVPLSPNWWLSKEKGKEAAVRLITERDGRQVDQVEFEILTGKAARACDPDNGTVAGGDAVSPWDNLAIDGDYIKAEAQAGRMGSQLYAVAVRINGKRSFRAPTQVDFDALAAAEAELQRVLPRWEADDVLPTESVPIGNKTGELLNMGMTRWVDLFSSRQLLAHGTFVEEFRRLVDQLRDESADRADSILALLSLMVGKAVNFDAILSSWHASRNTLRSVFDAHNFAFKWSYAEFEGSRELYPWCLGQVADAYEGIAQLLEGAEEQCLEQDRVDRPIATAVRVKHGNAADMNALPDASQYLVCIDPPYGDNVMYAELSDFFYVWEKRTLGQVWPELFEAELTDKNNEAVANLARFVDAGRRRKELAKADYEAKMHAVFVECRRVLADDGVMTVMFTHKSADAWDALGSSLMEAGFTIEASWPVNTESEQSLHQAKKNAAASTIMLVCRKRNEAEGGAFFEDLEPQVRAAARTALLEFAAKGISGVDLLLATYGPALSVISSQWPVYSPEADPLTNRSRLLRPEEALDAARAEVARLQRQRLIGSEQALDPITDFALVAWDTFKAREFPFDEARRLALAVGGMDVDELKKAKVVEKKSGTVTLLAPAKRLRRHADHEAGLSGVYPEATSFTVALDAVQTVLYVSEVDGLAAAKALIDRAGLAGDARFLAALQGLAKAMPATKLKGEWAVAEAGLLDALCTAYFSEIELPADESAADFEQSSLFGEAE